MTRTILLLALVAAASAWGCTARKGDPELTPVVSAPRSMDTPAGPGSGEPHLAVGSDGVVYLSWFEARPGGGHRLMLAELGEHSWSEPAIIAEGDSFFVNWADFPTVLPLGGDRLVAHWPWRSGSDTYAYDVRVAMSSDGGRNWNPSLVPHDDGTPTEHGFVSMVPEGDGARLIWLDGRNFAAAEAGGHGDEHGGADMTLRSAHLSADGRLSDQRVLDERVCDCCQTDAVVVGGGVLVSYRDRGDDERRDISLVRFDGSNWSEPIAGPADGWVIHGCPVNGAALAAVGEQVVMAWYTEADTTPRVQVAFSHDGGRSFGEAYRVDGGAPVGRVDAVLLDDGVALVSWVEKADTSAAIQLRHVGPSGAMTEPLTVALTSPARRSGFPRMVRSGNRLILAWTHVEGETKQLRVASSNLTGTSVARR